MWNSRRLRHLAEYQMLSVKQEFLHAETQLSVAHTAAPWLADGPDVLSPDALKFVALLHVKFNARRTELLKARETRQADFDRGMLPDLLADTAAIRSGDWSVAEPPSDLRDRRVEITGPITRKMFINALNSGARVFMADSEDALSPTWQNIVQGQQNLFDAARLQLSLDENGKQYRLKDEIATIVMRPRGWHLVDSNLTVNGEPVSASLLDFGLHFFHNATALLKRGSGPYFYLPKLESHLEARLWNDVFTFSQNQLNIPHGTIRATVLIETLPASLEMEEILFELKDHASGLNAGRWDYIFSFIKVFRKDNTRVLPDRAQVTMTVPFMRAYAERLVAICHKRGAHAIGGMSAFIPNRRDKEVNDTAFANVLSDKLREASQGFDGTWVAHPDLVAVARQAFDPLFTERTDQKHIAPDIPDNTAALIDSAISGASVTLDGIRNNIRVALLYIQAWLDGSGAVAIDNLMEDAATAEICRAQLWQWLQHAVTLDNGKSFSTDFYTELVNEQASGLPGTEAARQILDQLVLQAEPAAFLTLLAYPQLR